MQIWAEKLKTLQAVQIRMAKMRKELAEMPAERERVKSHYAGEQAAVDEAQKTLKAQEVSIRSLDGQIATIQTKKRDFQSKSSLIKSNDEYRAAMLQIEMCDKSISDLEDQQLGIMEAMDQQRRVIAARQVTLKEAESKAGIVLKRLDNREREIDESIGKLEADLPRLKEGIEPEILAEYLRLRGSQVISQTQPVLVPVDGDCCGGCRMQITDQIKRQVMNGHVVCCPSCQSILYWDD